MVEFEHRLITCIIFMKITKYHRHMLFLTLRHKYFYQSVAHTHVLSISRSISKIIIKKFTSSRYKYTSATRVISEI